MVLLRVVLVLISVALVLESVNLVYRYEEVSKGKKVTGEDDNTVSYSGEGKRMLWEGSRAKVTRGD